MARELAELDRSVLSFAAAHDLVLSSQIRQVAGEEVPASQERAQRLCEEGLLARGPRLSYQRGSYRITRLGLDRVGSDLPEAAAVDVRRYWRDLGLGWLWVHAHLGHFGQAEAIYSRRAMRAADAVATSPSSTELLSPSLLAKVTDARFAMPTGAGRLRYPGLVLVLAQGRFAFELVLSEPSPRWLDEIVSGYVAKPQVRVVVLLASTEQLADGLRDDVARRDLGDRVQVQHGRFSYGSR